MRSLQVFEEIFHCLLLFATFFMLIFATIRYYNDESTASVDFQVFHNREKDIYPSVSFCLSNADHPKPWYESTLALYDLSKNRSSNVLNREGMLEYVHFLMGNDSNPKHILSIKDILEINYDDVTMDLRDILNGIKIQSTDQILIEWSKGNVPKPGKTSYRHPLLRCFTIDILEEVLPGITGHELYSIEIDFLRPVYLSDNHFKLDLGVFVHYPNQMFRAILLESLAYFGHKSEIIQTIYTLGTIEVLRRRQTRAVKCHDKKDDEMILRELVKRVGCRPQHWPLEEYPLTEVCTNEIQMRRLLTPTLKMVDSKFLQNFPPPCNQMESISYEEKSIRPPIENVIKEFGTPSTFARPVSGKERKNWESSIFGNKTSFKFIFRNSNYREIVHVQSFNIESWIGNVGGYGGLFLGVSLWQASGVIGIVFKNIKLFINTINTIKASPI